MPSDYDYIETLTGKDKERAERAIALAERCGVPYNYSRSMLWEYDFLSSRERDVIEAARMLLQMYQGTYANPDNPTGGVSWSMFKRLTEK